MKLLRLKINDDQGFRSLQSGFEVHFLREWDYDKAYEFNPYVLAGPNGSGKSNILEALAAIFYHLECIYLNYWPASFEYDEDENPQGFQAKIGFPDAYELEYFIVIPDNLNDKNPVEYAHFDFAHISISKEADCPPLITWINRDLYNDGKKELDRSEVKAVLPANVIAYSSGENEILSLPFFKMRFIHFDEYMDRLTESLDYGEMPEGRLTFLDNAFSQAIILSNFLLQPKEVLRPFTEELGLVGIWSFRIIIRKTIDFDERQYPDFPRKHLEERENDDRSSRFVLNLTRLIEADDEPSVPKIINKLKNCSTTQYFDTDTDTLYLDYWVNDATRRAFALYFGSPQDLFKAFQILLTLNLYTVNTKLKQELYHSSSLYVNETVPVLASDQQIMCFEDFLFKKSHDGKTVYGRSLSDGEHQFVYSLGLCLLFKDGNNLFLLDEPETHFNPDWRAKFISRLRDCFKHSEAGTTMREILVTTHSPFLISDSRPENVILFEKEQESGTIQVSQPDFNTFGASIGKITAAAFAQAETVGDYAKQKIHELDKRLEQGDDEEAIIADANRQLGDSVEKVLFVNKVLNRGEET